MKTILIALVAFVSSFTARAQAVSADDIMDLFNHRQDTGYLIHTALRKGFDSYEQSRNEMVATGSDTVAGYSHSERLHFFMKQERVYSVQYHTRDSGRYQQWDAWLQQHGFVFRKGLGGHKYEQSLFALRQMEVIRNRWPAGDGSYHYTFTVLAAEQLDDKAWRVADGQLKFRIPCSYVENADLLKVLQNANSHIVYAAAIDLPGGGQRTVFAVSRYTYDQPMDIDRGYDISVNTKAGSDQVYTLSAHSVYNTPERVLRNKISRILFNGKHEVISTMYYFMKDDYSQTLYELKISCSPDQAGAAREVLEQMGRSVVFM